MNNKRRKSSLSAGNSNQRDSKIKNEKLVRSADSSKDKLRSSQPDSNNFRNSRTNYNSQDEFVNLLYNDMVDIFLSKWSRPKISSDENAERGESNEPIEVEKKLPKLDDHEYVELYFPNKNVYVGYINRNKQIDGEGEYRWACGEKYQGKFERNSIQGKGRMEWIDGSWYEGEFHKNYRHGIGNYNSHENGRFYIGNWFMGRKHSQGYCRYDNKAEDYYEGEWKMNKRHGKGKRSYRNGTRYIGEWENDKINGTGSMIWQNGDLYRGGWKNGIMSGYGVYVWKGFLNKSLTWPKENSYMGEWLDGKRHGKGVLKLNSTGGAKYSGNWYLDQKHGYGMIIGNSGAVTEGDPLFLNNILVPALEDEFEEYENPNPFNNEGDTPMLIRHKKPRKTAVFEPSQFLPLLYHVDRLLNPGEFGKNNSTRRGSVRENTANRKCEVCKSESTCRCINNYEPSVSDFSFVNIKINDNYDEDKKTYEERWVKNCLITHIKELRRVYKLYGEIYCDENSAKPTKNLSMSNLSLWQLMRDCDIHKNSLGISLVEFQRYFDTAMNKSAFIESEFNPFERIEFYQFLNALLEFSWHLCTKLGDIETDLMRGKLAGGLHRFLVKDVFPNAGKFVGNLSKIFINLLPIDCVYKLYRSVGEPHTAKKFLRATCVLNGFNDPKPSPVGQTLDERRLIKLTNGENAITIGERLSWIECDKKSSKYQSSSSSLSTINHEDDDFAHELFALRHLGVEKMLFIISKICPNIKDAETANVIVNIDYEFTFLEFYEILIEASGQLIYARKSSQKEKISNINLMS